MRRTRPYNNVAHVLCYYMHHALRTLPLYCIHLMEHILVGWQSAENSLNITIIPTLRRDDGVCACVCAWSWWPSAHPFLSGLCPSTTRHEAISTTRRPYKNSRVNLRSWNLDLECLIHKRCVPVSVSVIFIVCLICGCLLCTLSGNPIQKLQTTVCSYFW